MEKKAEGLDNLATQVLTERLPDPAGSLPPIAPPAPPSPDHEDPLRAVKRLERLGGGGFGEVWRVRYLGSEEAWKYIPIRPGSSERTGREAIHARRVDHPNVVRVLDVLRVGDHYVLRMDLVRGRDFFRVVNEDGILPPAEAVACGLQVAAALQHAHDQGVVHLDLKPHNLIQTEDGARVMVTDFGISASMVQDRRDLPGPEAGTPFFMAPEQFNSPGEVGSGVDIWSLGVTLYWCLSQSYPFRFEGKTPGQVIQEDPVIPLADVAPHVHPALCRVIHSMLEKDPARRPKSMSEVIEELKAIQNNSGNLSARRGDHAFALCLFDEAMEHYRQAARRKDREGERAARLLEIARESKAEHEVQVGRIEERLAQNDLPGALLLLTNARRRFSRSPKLREHWERLAKEIINLFGSPRRAVERDLRRAMFAEARSYLDLLTSLLGVPGGRKILRSAGDEAVLEEAVVQLLKTSVDQAQSTYHQLQAAVEDAVQAMDFARARDTMEELQNRCPLPGNVERMRRFAEASESVTIISEYPFDLLAKIGSREVKATAERPFLLVRAEAKCQELLNAFDPRLYPIFEEIQEKSRALKAAIESLQSHAAPVLEAVKKSQRAANLALLRRELDTAGDVILHTDIFNKDVREQVREIKRQLEAMTEKADRLYREGHESLERRQFNKAITAFEEALRLGGGNQTDIDALILASSQSAERRRSLAEDLQALDLAIWSQGASLADVAVFLEKTEEFLKLQEDPKHGETIARAAAALETAVDLAASEAARLSASRKLDALKELAAAFTPATPQLLRMAAAAAAGLPPRLEALVEAVLPPVTRAPGTGGAQPADPSVPLALARYKEIAATLAAMEPIVAHARAAWDRHPSWQVAERVLNLVLSNLDSAGGAAGDALGREAEELLAQLAALAPAAVSEKIQSERRRIVEKLRRRQMARTAKVALRSVSRIGLPFLVSLALATAAFMAEKAVDGWREEQTLRSAIEAVRKDPRWSAVEGLQPRGASERELALALVSRDLPAFSALCDLSDPNQRFWSRCVEASRILSSIAPERTAILGRSAIRKEVEDTLLVDLDTAVEAWVAQATPLLSAASGGEDRGLRAVMSRLTVAESVLGGLKLRRSSDSPGFPPLADRAAELRKQGQTLLTIVDSVPGFVAELRGAGGPERARSANAFGQRYLEIRSAAPSEGWQKLLDCQVLGAFCDALRERPPWTAEEGKAPAAYDLLRLMAFLRERAGPLPLDSSWTEKVDPFYRVLSKVLR